MTEHDHAERIMRELDGVMRGDTLLEGDALLDTARTLLDADFNAEIPLALRSPAILTKGQPQMMSRTHRVLRALLAAAAVFVIAGAAILAIPPLRAFAQDILRQIGIIKVTDGPTDYERAQRPIPALDLARASGEWHPISTEEIETNINWRAVFEAIPPGFERLEYGEMTDYELMLGFNGFRLYRNGESEPALTMHELYRLSPYGPIDYETGGAQTEQVDIDGIPGTWISGFDEHPELDVQLLIWEADWHLSSGDQLTLILQGRGATKAEMLGIAHALTIRTIESIPLNQRRPFISSDRTPQNVANQLGFDVAVLPTRTYYPSEIFNVYQGEDFAQVDSTSSGLVMQQVKVYDASLVNPSAWQYNVGSTPVEDVEVNGNTGVWIEGLPTFPEAKQNILLWEQDGFSFVLGSNRHSKEAMIEVAESITFVGPE